MSTAFVDAKEIFYNCDLSGNSYISFTDFQIATFSPQREIEPLIEKIFCKLEDNGQLNQQAVWEELQNQGRKYEFWEVLQLFQQATVAKIDYESFVNLILFN